MNFELPKGYKKTNPKILEKISDDFPGKNFHYLFMGGVGVGKTYLARSIVDAYKKQDDCVRFAWLSCAKIYRDYLDNENRFNWDYLTCDLVIDDIGDENPDTAAAKNFTKEILTRRYENIQDRNWFKNWEGVIEREPVTILTTNYGKNELLAAYGERVVDRMRELCVAMVFKGQSLRKENYREITG